MSLPQTETEEWLTARTGEVRTLAIANNQNLGRRRGNDTSDEEPMAMTTGKSANLH